MKKTFVFRIFPLPHSIYCAEHILITFFVLLARLIERLRHQEMDPNGGVKYRFEQRFTRTFPSGVYAFDVDTWTNHLIVGVDETLFVLHLVQFAHLYFFCRPDNSKVG